jgi:hypothetical protein
VRCPRRLLRLCDGLSAVLQRAQSPGSGAKTLSVTLRHRSLQTDPEPTSPLNSRPPKSIRSGHGRVGTARRGLSPRAVLARRAMKFAKRLFRRCEKAPFRPAKDSRIGRAEQRPPRGVFSAGAFPCLPRGWTLTVAALLSSETRPHGGDLFGLIGMQAGFGQRGSSRSIQRQGARWEPGGGVRPQRRPRP